MKTLLLLIDLQEDFLSHAGLEPPRAWLVTEATRLAAKCRGQGIEVAHVWTEISEGGPRLPHWKTAGRESCLRGTAGVLPAPGLEAEEGEKIFRKTVFSPFVESDLETYLRKEKVERLWLAGVHLQTCVKQSALDAYQRGWEVVICREAVGSGEPFLAAQTKFYLERRGVRFLGTEQLFAPTQALLTAVPAKLNLPALLGIGGEEKEGRGGRRDHFSPIHSDGEGWSSRDADAGQVEEAVKTALQSRAERPFPESEERLPLLESAAVVLEGKREDLARILVEDLGKPIRMAREEVGRAIELLRVVAHRTRNEKREEGSSGVRVRRLPLGVVGIITPWNNPLAIPLGQLAPSFAWGNSTIWKPAPGGLRIAVETCRLLAEAGWPRGSVVVIGGGEEIGASLAGHGGIDALSVTGSRKMGWETAALCHAAAKPFQAELGGNNAAIVWPALADAAEVMRQAAAAAFGFAGQRCTAVRRLILPRGELSRWLPLLLEATENISWGDPFSESTQIGPMASPAQATRVEALLARWTAGGGEFWQPHLPAGKVPSAYVPGSAYHPPTIVLCEDPAVEIVQEETFGPVLVIQPADDFGHALQLLNNVNYGLTASLVGGDAGHQKQFLSEAQAGILRLGGIEAGAGTDVPFGGWKGSGRGLAQHGEANRWFYSKGQSVYGTGAKPAQS